MKPATKKLKDEVDDLIDEHSRQTNLQSIKIYLELEEKKKIVEHKLQSKISHYKMLKKSALATINREQLKIKKTMGALFGPKKFNSMLQAEKKKWMDGWKEEKKEKLQPKDINTSTPDNTTTKDRGDGKNESEVPVVREEMGVQGEPQVHRDMPGLHEEGSDKGTAKEEASIKNDRDRDTQRNVPLRQGNESQEPRDAETRKD